MSKKYTFIDLFAGCGGLSEGFLETGYFEGLAHVEWEYPMIQTLRNRLIKKWNYSFDQSLKSVIHFDIQKTDELINGRWSNNSKSLFSKTNHDLVIKNGLKGIIGKRSVDLIIGGPPCQAYSIAGRAQDKNSMKDDYRNFLFESFLGVVNEFKPKLFIFENVPGMLSAEPGGIKVTERVYRAFKKIGYQINLPKSLKSNIYNAEDFTVPQKRKRLIIVGVNENYNLDLNEVYTNIDHEKRNNKVFVKDVLHGLPRITPLKESIRKNGKNISHIHKDKNHNLTRHEPRFHNKRDINIFTQWISKKMNQKPIKEKIDFYNQLLKKQSKHAKYRNLEWEKTSPTVVAHLHKDGLMFIHPDEKQARSITVREAAILQSFPNDFEFIGSNGYCYKMIGNAVPPKMAEFIANGIYKTLKLNE